MIGALRETQVRARRAARVRSLAARVPALAGRTRQPLRAAVDAAPFDKEELLAALPRADALVALHPVRAVERHLRRALCALDALGALLERGAARQTRLADTLRLRGRGSGRTRPPSRATAPTDTRRAPCTAAARRRASRGLRARSLAPDIRRPEVRHAERHIQPVHIGKF
jgi:hypothetical protein